MFTAHMSVSQSSDEPRDHGIISEALKAILLQEDLLDIDILLRYRGIRTLRALASLEAKERAVLLVKARELYECLGLFPSNLQNALGNLFSHAECGVHNLRSSGSPLPPGSVGVARVSNVAMDVSCLDLAGRNGSRRIQQDPLTPLGFGGRAQGPVPLACLDDDTSLRRSLGKRLEAAKEVVGEERIAEAVRRLRRSDELAAASCLEAAEALAVCSLVGSKDEKPTLKAVKLVLRDVIMWRCIGSVLGMDSREALVRSVDQAVRYTRCSEHTVSQITNGYLRTIRELAGVQAPSKKRDSVSVSPSRSRAPGRQEPRALSRRASASRKTSQGGLAVGLCGRNSIPASCEPQKSRLEVQSMTQFDKTSLELATRVAAGVSEDCLEPEMPVVRKPPGLEEPVQACGFSLPCQPFIGLSAGAVQSESAVLSSRKDGMVLAMPNIQGRLFDVFVACALHELGQAVPEHIVECALWLGRVLDHSIAGRDGALVASALAGLAQASQLPGLDEHIFRQVLRSLARVAGLEFLVVPPAGDVIRAERCSQGLGNYCIMTETWAWLLGECCCLELESMVEEAQLSEIVDHTLKLLAILHGLSPMHTKDVARDCCVALRVLGQLGKENMFLMHRVFVWLLKTTDGFIAYPEVVHEGLRGMVAICQARKLLFGIDLGDGCGPNSDLAAAYDECQSVGEVIMGLAYNIKDRREYDNNTYQQALRLLVHTHSWAEVVSFTLCSKQRSRDQMLRVALEEAHDGMKAAVGTWSECTDDGKSALTDPGRCFRNSAVVVLAAVQVHGGTGLEA